MNVYKLLRKSIMGAFRLGIATLMCFRVSRADSSVTATRHQCLPPAIFHVFSCLLSSASITGFRFYLARVIVVGIRPRPRFTTSNVSDASLGRWSSYETILSYRSQLAAFVDGQLYHYCSTAISLSSAHDT
jgi:hypothetical protein